VFASDLSAAEDAQSVGAKPPTRAEQVARVSTRQVANRMRHVDEMMRRLQAGCTEHPGSDWRLLELYLQKIHEDVLIFLRGDSDDKSFFKDGTGAVLIR
jgi:hypothetical protein